MSLKGEIAEATVNIEPNNAPPAIEYDEHLDCLHGVVEGDLDIATIESYVKQVVHLAQVQECRCILSDLRRADLKLSILEIYGLPALMEGMGFGRPWRGALVISEGLEEFQFLETVAKNQGFNLRVFKDFDRAVAWIAERR